MTSGQYALQWGDSTITPIAGLTYSRLRQNGYTETGGNGAALNVGASASSSLKSELGIRLERSFMTAYGEVVPSAQLGWRHEYQNTRLQSTASFVADSAGATGFTKQGAKPVSDTGVLSERASLLRGKNLSLSGRYVLEAGLGYVSQGGVCNCGIGLELLLLGGSGVVLNGSCLLF